ncbi:MAG: hypothetical protein Kow0068_23050 [Marinilabiliales bacterium]
MSLYGFSQEISTKDSVVFDGNTYVKIPGTDISFAPPAHFIPVKDQLAFVHIGSSSSIQIKVIENTPFQLVTKDMDADFFAKQNVTLLGKEYIKTKSGKDGVMFLVSFKIKSKEVKEEIIYERLMFFTGDYNRTIWINANYPQVIRGVLFEVFKESMTSVQF